MRVDMTPILTGRTDKIGFAFDWEGAGDLFPEFCFEKPVHVEGEITERSGCLLLTLGAEVFYKTECARCLKELHRTLTLSLSKNAAVKGTLQDVDDDDYVIIEDSAMELDEPVGELLFLELPSRDLCSEDCRGFCPKCGKDRNEGDCGCDTKEIDPRLAVLKQFLTTENE
ncbi:MAG: DUF177 domain-containing protein [Clostridia bacterium]|nr:DUF177 domain-containing protein [Clostridia bacterium]